MDVDRDSMRARFEAGQLLLDDEGPARQGPRGRGDAAAWTAAEHVARARRATGAPWTRRATDAELLRLARDLITRERRRGEPLPQWRADMTQSALRHLLLAGPDAQLH